MLRQARSCSARQGQRLRQRDEQNPNIVVRKGDQTVTLPINKSVAYVGNDCIQLSGLVILSGGNTYVPSDAVELIN